MGMSGLKFDGALGLKVPDLVKKLNRGDVKYTDSFWDDFWFYLRNNHIVLAIFCAHPMNPNSRNSRFLAFLSSNAFALFLACLAPFILKGQSQVTVIILEYIVFALLETIVDIQSQTLASCSCCHRDGVPYCVRCIVIPILGCVGGCCMFMIMATALLVMVIIYAADYQIKSMDAIFKAYLITKSISLVVGIFPLGLLSYAWCRRGEENAANKAKSKDLEKHPNVSAL